MATDEKNETSQAEPTANKGEEQPKPPQIAVRAQYIKDFSFENPLAPRGLMTQPSSAPKIDVQVDVNAARQGEDVFEVALGLRIQADIEASGDEEAPKQKALFLAELDYAGLFQVAVSREEDLQPALLIYGPSLLFPFARQILADITQQGGFAPLMLDPIDFGVLYARRQAQAQQEAKDKA